MMHRLAQNGVTCINLNDYNELSTSVRNREKFDSLIVRVNCPQEISHCLVTMIFRGGERYYLSNLYLWVIPYRIHSYTGCHAREFLPQCESKYDAMQIPIIQVIELHYKISTTVVMVRQCEEHDFIIRTNKGKKIIDAQKFYYQMRNDFEKFIAGLKGTLLPEIITPILAQKWVLILSDSELRKGIVAPKSSSKNKMKLTQRELQCLSLISMGLSVKEISESLHLSTETVSTHTKSIRRKMNCTSISEAVSKAFRTGLLF